jgi:RNase P/RNase MRP subunit p30
MKRQYADLHLTPNIRDFQQVSVIVNKAAQLGYHLIALLFPPNTTQEELKQIQTVCKEAKLDIATRIDLKPRTPNDLTYNLRKFRRKFEIIAVLCESKNVARQAAKDHRVDLLSFSSTDFRQRFFDMAEAELASASQASLEINTRPLLTLEGPARSRLLASLRKEASIAKGFKVPIIISSGTSNELLMRKPQEQAILAQLFDLDREYALDAVSRNPTAVVTRNSQKLSPKFIAPGIRLVKKGKDC